MQKCIAPTCFRQTVDRQLTCSQHWQELPSLMQDEIRLAYAARARGGAGASEKWLAVKRRAIDALAQQRVSAAVAR
jgi:hypothetical protein